MSKVRLYTFDDLYDFFVNQNKNVIFDAEKEHSQIVVQLPGNIDFSKKKSEKDIEGLMPVVLRACHTKTNRNQSNIEKDVMESALASFSNRPILGYIHEVDGKPCFWSHNMHEDEEGDLVFDEIPVGVICESCNAHLEYDEEADVDRVVVNGYIYEEYSKAAEILQREEKLDVSVELNIRALSYDAKNKHLNIEDFYFCGVTILQCDEAGNKIEPGMEGSNITLENFSKENNSIQFSADEKLIEVLDKLNNTLSKFNINEETQENTEEGGNNTDMNHFEELLQKYNKTVEDIDFEYSEMTDEELDAKFAELFEESETEEGSEPASEGSEVEVTVEESEEVDEEETVSDTEEESETETEESDDVEVTDTEACGGGSGSGTKKKKNCLISINDTEYNFELSLDDIQYALYSLVNDMYSEADNTWYSVSVYEGYVIMNDWWNGRNYKQTYSRDEDNFSLTGDRVEVYANWLTKEEEDSLAEMRSNYSSIQEELAEYKKNELHSKLEEILNAEEYAAIAETDEFKALKETMDSYSTEELQTKADLLYAKFAKANFAMNKPEVETKPKMVFMAGTTPDVEKLNKPYGGIFERLNK